MLILSVQATRKNSADNHNESLHDGIISDMKTKPGPEYSDRDRVGEEPAYAAGLGALSAQSYMTQKSITSLPIAILHQVVSNFVRIGARPGQVSGRAAKTL
jgi:hypothetical protein